MTRWIVAACAVAVLGCAPAAAAAVKPPSSFPAAGEILRAKVVARVAPSPRARAIRVVKQFRADFHFQVVLATEMRLGTDRHLWYRISIPMRPNGTMGWIRADGVKLSPVRNRIVIHRASRRLEVWRGQQLLLSTTVAVGKPGAETPLGTNYYITSRFVPRNTFLGTFALETSAYSRLTDWPGGGVVGIHGTSVPGLLGQAVSSGCVRVRNDDVNKLKTLAPLGTPIDVFDD